MSIECKVEKGLCRCCFNDGSFKNLGDPWLEQGEHVYYADMLQKCLNIELNPVPGPLYAVTYMICDDCILRLKDACTFKYQVAQCEERFQELYGKNVIKLAPSCDIPVKQEAPDSDDEDATLITIKIDAEDDNDDDDEGFTVQNDDDDSIYDTDQDIRELEEKETKKAKPKTTKPKPKAKPKTKPKARPRKPNAASKEQPDSKEEEEGDKEKKEYEVPIIGWMETEEKVKKRGKASASRAKKPKLESGDSSKSTNWKQYYHILDSQYVCNFCQRTFSSQPLFSQHYRFVHLKHQPKERKCPHCDIKVSCNSRAYHLEDEHGIPAPFCKICQKRFRYPALLKKHQKQVHMGEKKATCTVCAKSFIDISTLKRHMLTHSSEKMFKCDMCGREFRQKCHLKDHILVHMRVTRYNCKVCEKGYVGKSSLQKHINRKH